MTTIGNGYGGVPYQQPVAQQAQSPSPVNSKGGMGMGFLKSLSGIQKKASSSATKDGQAPKRRGPKPDSKPALTRRQELNRQAQRTHRERKEHYIKALEHEVQSLRENYSQGMLGSSPTYQSRDTLVQLQDENQFLKDLLRSNGIQFEAELERRKAARQKGSPYPDSSAGYTPNWTQDAGQVGLTTPPATVTSGMSPQTTTIDRGSTSMSQGGSSSGVPSHGYHSHPTPPYNLSNDSDHLHEIGTSALPGIFQEDPQLGIDFILSLEGPCRDHTELLCRRSEGSPDDENALFSGHALMASCPPPTHLAKDPATASPYPHKTYDLPPANLSILLNLSRQLVAEGEITPIMALHKLQKHEKYAVLTREDIRNMMGALEAKVRCYGFGAVLEDFEVRDAMNSVLGTKGELMHTDYEQMYG